MTEIRAVPVEGVAGETAGAAYAARSMAIECSGFEAEAGFLHAMLRGHDWYALAGSAAEKELHARLTRLVSCDEFGDLIRGSKATTSA